MSDKTGAGERPVLPRYAAVIKPVILAAGASRRLGQAKQLVPWGGKALIAHALDAALQAQTGAGPVAIIVAPALRAAIADALGLRPALLIDNPFAAEGMASSLRLAVAAAQDAQADGLLLLLSDQPLIDAPALNRLCSAFASNPARPAASHYGRITAGVPAIVPRAMFSELAALRGDVGARAVLRAASPTLVDMPQGALDIDRPQDLQRLPPSP